MQLKPITAIVVLLLVVASLLVSGCTVGIPASSPTPTPTTVPTATPVPDYSSILTNNTESGSFIMERPFTKSINERGNDVYKGVGRNATLAGSQSVTLVFEVTKSEAEAKQVYDKAVKGITDQGYTIDPTFTANFKANNPSSEAAWFGYYGKSMFLCTYYYYGYPIHDYVVVQQTFSMSLEPHSEFRLTSPHLLPLYFFSTFD